MKHRFYIANDNLEVIVEGLEEKGYMQLPDAGHEITGVIIDNELRQFWMTDNKHVRANIEIIKDRHGLNVHHLDALEIEESLWS